MEFDHKTFNLLANKELALTPTLSHSHFIYLFIFLNFILFLNFTLILNILQSHKISSFWKKGKGQLLYY